MAEERDMLETAALERALAEIAGEIDYPPTPDLASAVRERLAAAPPLKLASPGRIVQMRRRIELAAAALLVFALAALAIIPGTRSAIADRLGMGGVEIVPTATLAPPTPGTGASLDLGEQMAMADALAGLDFQPYLPPSALGQADAVFLREPPAGGQLSYVYRPREDLPEVQGSGVGLLVSQFEGDTNESFVQKQIGPETTIELVEVGGRPGFWLSGEPHVFMYEDADGQIQPETLRLAANVLIWEADGITLRIESALPKDQVLAIAATMTR